MGIMYKECACDYWEQGMTQIDGFIMLGFSHGYRYSGRPFSYCPWCGQKIRETKKEETKEKTGTAKSSSTTIEYTSTIPD